MSLSERSKVASRGQRRHADTSGHTDGGPFGENNQGELEEVYVSQTPAAEAVVAPTGDGSKVTNTEGQLVASIRAKSADLQRDIHAYQSLKAAASAGSPYRASVNVIAAMAPHQRKAAAEHMAASFKAANPRFSPRKFYAAINQKLAEATETPKTVDPALSGTDEQSLKGSDFDNVALGDVETQPKDASRKTFAAFDAWVQKATGRTASQHNPEWLRRQAARWAQAMGVNVQALYPALGNALRQARKGESSTGKAAMNRYAEDTSLEVAAPDGRIDVEAPVKNDTDADAQASQYDLKDFAHNAGDQLADPELSSDSQIWVPDQGGKQARKASGIAAVRYAEACINAGLAPRDDRWKLARQAETMHEAVVVDRTTLLERVASVNADRARTAAAQAPRSAPIPRGLTAPTRTASTHRIAENDVANDSALFF